jgi:hypothetical protein
MMSFCRLWLLFIEEEVCAVKVDLLYLLMYPLVYLLDLIDYADLI